MSPLNSTFSFFPTGEAMPIVFIPFLQQISRQIQLPPFIADFLKKWIGRLDEAGFLNDKEIYPILFSKKEYVSICHDEVFFKELEIITKGGRTCFWFIGDPKALQKIHCLLKSRFPEQKMYFHVPAVDDLPCEIIMNRRRKKWDLSLIPHERIAVFN